MNRRFVTPSTIACKQSILGAGGEERDNQQNVETPLFKDTINGNANQYKEMFDIFKLPKCYNHLTFLRENNARGTTLNIQVFYIKTAKM